MQKKSDLKCAIDYLDFLTSNNRYRTPSVDDQFYVAPEDNAESNHIRHRDFNLPTDSDCDNTQWAQHDLRVDQSAYREPTELDTTHGAERIVPSDPPACDEYQTTRLNSSVERWFTIACLLAIACGCFWYGFGGKSSDRSAGVSATQIDSNSPARFVTVPIRDIEPGQWVLAENPELAEVGPELLGQIDPSDYRKYGLRMTKSDGGTLELELLRPATWLPDGTPMGESVWLDLAELGAVGEATLLSIEPCPTLAERPTSRHQLVTGKFRHSSAEVLDLSIEGLSEPIGTTSSHPFWSEDRQTFVEAGSLQVGEQLLTADGQRVRLTSIVPRAGPQPVYNLEVNIQHVYFVAKSGVLVHNTYAPNRGPALVNSPQYQAGWQRIFGKTNGHHPWPMYLGGPTKQALEDIPEGMHKAYHRGLDKLLPRQRSAKYFRELSPLEQAQNFEKLRKYTEAFDAKHGTSLWQAIMKTASAID